MTNFYRPRVRRDPETLTDLVTVLGLANNAANVVMQLALPGVGHGVQESRVASGRAVDRPLKRARTTTAYLAVALYGNDRDKAELRATIARVHSHVHSTAASPVAYSGNSRPLQLWVAACLFRYYVDQYELLYGPLGEPALDRLTAAAAPLATGVNVPAEQWPQTWRAFEEYWCGALEQVAVAPEVRDYNENLANLRFLTGPWGPIGVALSSLLGPSFHFFTRATIHPEFRDAMGWDWTEDNQRRFDRLLKLIRILDRVYPGRALYYGHLMDLRIRRAFKRSPLGPLRLDGGRGTGAR